MTIHQLFVNIGTNNTSGIEPHWSYFLIGALTLLITIFMYWLTYQSHIKKFEHKNLEGTFKAWLLRNSFTLTIMFDIIFTLMTASLFMMGAGMFK